MSSGYQANGDKWVGFEDCDKHIATEGAACPICAVEALQAKVEEEKDILEMYKVSAERRITELEAKIEALTEALKDIYKATTDLQVMSIVMANLPQPKTIPVR